MQRKKTHEVVTGREPVGNLCVVHDESLNAWSVHICTGLMGERTPLKQFSTRGEAESFANAELIRLNASDTPGKKRYILHVDDCPCWQKEL